MSTLYDEDVLVWSERQAALLRELGRTRRDLPNELDIDNVAEEIESVGRSELQAVESFLRLVLTHAIKAASVPREPLTWDWLEEIGRFRTDAVQRLTPSMPGRVDLQRIWLLAQREARHALRRYGQDPLTLPAACPVPLEMLLAEDVDPEEIVNRIAAASAHFPGED